MKRFIQRHAERIRGVLSGFDRPHGGVNGNFQGEVVSDIGRRADHLRIKHRLDRNWIKMYDKQGSVLRVETTLNDGRGIKVFRRTEGQARWQTRVAPTPQGCGRCLAASPGQPRRE